MNLIDLAKLARSQALLEMGGLHLYADTRGPECRMYSTARSGECQLLFSRTADPPIADLDLDEVKIAGTLVFGGAYHPCLVPWSRVWAVRLVGRDVTDGLVVWPESTPIDVEPDLVRVLKQAKLWQEPVRT